MAIFGPKPWVNPFGKISIFRLFELLVFIAQKGVVSFQNIVKDIFQPYISLTKNLEEMAIFGPEPWVKTLKISFFLFFEILVYSLEKRSFLLEYSKKHFPGLYCPPKKMEKWPFQDSFVLEYSKRHFPGRYCLKKKLEKWPFLDQNYRLTPLEKFQFFDFLNFLFLQPRKALFRFRIT